MPEGLEKDLRPDDMADLLAFLEGSGRPRRRSRVIVLGWSSPAPTGRSSLIAADAEIRGDRLVFEPEHGNLGCWMAANDRAAWMFDVVRPGKYSVWLDWACPNAAAGNALDINLGGQHLRYAVGGTGTRDDYSLTSIGELDLPEGQCRLEVRPRSPQECPAGPRRIELRPDKPPPGSASSSARPDGRVCSYSPRPRCPSR